MIPGSANPLLLKQAAAAGGYQITRSLRFNSSDSAYCSRVPASAGNRKTWTWSGWVKRGGLGARQNIFGTGDASFYNGFWVEFFSDDKIRIGDIGPSTLDLELITTQVFRDCSAWGHLLVALDTGQATAANRLSVYWNGSKITTFDTASYPSLNFDTRWNTTAAHSIGRAGSYNAQYFNGYLADIHFIDGQALTPSSFTEVSATTGQLIPKAYTGSYGTNGFRLPFSDNSAATSTTLGKDSAGSNNWTPNNLSVTAGSGNDSLVDTPTSYGTDDGLGGSVRGNYCTWNPLAKGTDVTLANGNLDMTSSSSAQATTVIGTIGVTAGKWYWEITCTGSDPRNGIGIAKQGVDLNSWLGSNALGWGYVWGGQKGNNGSQLSYGASFTTNDVIGVAFDADAGTLTFYKNNVSQGQAYSGLTSGPYFPALADDSGGGVAGGATNFGQRPFAYTAPSGFKALCDTNLPAPVVAKPNTVMDVVTYTGTGATLTPTSTLGFSPDLVWIKSRSAATDNTLYDVVRGAQIRLESNNTDAEVATDSGLTAFNSDGFTLGTLAQVNTNTATYAAWTWDAGSSTVTNTQGSITTSVRANASAGFSVVTYTGNATNSTIGHGLGVAPELLILKNRDGASNWAVWHKAFGTAGATDYLYLNSTIAKGGDGSGSFWNSTVPTSTVFSIGNGSTTNTNANKYVAYCFAPVAGYSSFGSYDGNGSADGPFVYTGFRPRWLLYKPATAVNQWMVVDAVRDTFNAAGKTVFPNLSNAEADYTGNFPVDFLSNGFKLRNSNAGWNGNGTTYIWAAFAESPFQYARAR